MKVAIPVFKVKKDCMNGNTSAYIIADSAGWVTTVDKNNDVNVAQSGVDNFVCISQDLVLYMDSRGDERQGILWANDTLLCWVDKGTSAKLYPVILHAMYDSGLIVVRNTSPALVIKSWLGKDEFITEGKAKLFDEGLKIKVEKGVLYSDVVKILEGDYV